MAERSIRDPGAPRLRARRAADAVAPDDGSRPTRLRSDRIGDRAAGVSNPIEAEAWAAEDIAPDPVGGRADRRSSDRRRLLAATASAVLPGAGQALNGRLRTAIAFAIPSLVAVAAGWAFVRSDTPAVLLARVLAPSILAALLLLNVVILAWRLVAVGQAFLDRRYPLRPGRLGALGIAVVLLATVTPHLAAWQYGVAAQDMLGRIFAGSAVRSLSTTPPAADTRLNVLLIGIDSAPGRQEALTDSLIVVSLDPVGRTVSLVSIPRDLASIPLGDGDTYAPKINSLMSYAERNPKQFPEGGISTLERAVSALFGIPIHAYASVDLAGFAKMVDAVGGVDINVKKPLDDPHYPRLDGGHGWSVTAGPQHFNGLDALAYARIRKVIGESDLTRAARQQEVLVALRNEAVGAGLLVNLPSLLDAVGATVRTDLPRDQLPLLAALAEQIGGSRTTRVVLGSPEIKGASGPYGSMFVPVPAKIRALSKVVFGTPGADPTWPVPKPSPPGGAEPVGSPASSSLLGP